MSRPLFSPIPGRGFLAAALAAGRYRINPAVGLERRCSHCFEYWPADTEFFAANRAERSGLCSWCKACYSEARRARRSEAA